MVEEATAISAAESRSVDAALQSNDGTTTGQAWQGALGTLDLFRPWPWLLELILLLRSLGDFRVWGLTGSECRGGFRGVTGTIGP